MVTPVCSVCKSELAVDLQEQLKAYRTFYDSMSLCERVEFRVRVVTPEAAEAKASVAAKESAAETRQAVSSAVHEVRQAVQEAVAMALAQEPEMHDSLAASTKN